jgi:hypothetical protein
MKQLPRLLLANLFLILIVGCSKSESIPNDHGAISARENKTFFEEVGSLKPYNSSSLYALQMGDCVYADTSEKSCTVSTLPLIGIAKENITVQDILDRTMISHEFLGETFKEVLLKMKPEILQMFGAVTAIVISDRINPSFYYRISGAIYLSGRYFWKNTEEYKILNQVKDYRDGAELPFKFVFDHDYINNGKSYLHRAAQNSQTYSEMAIIISRLLFHELTHANDYFPKSVYRSSEMEPNKTYAQISHSRFSNSQLASMRQATKLASFKLNQVAQVLYQGNAVTSYEENVQTEEAITEFKNDIANDLYSYSTDREDLAMAAEEALMLYYYNIPRIVGVISLPTTENYSLAWGEISRVLEPKIKARAVFAVENGLGKSIAENVSKRLDQSLPIEIPANTPWDDVYKIKVGPLN